MNSHKQKGIEVPEWLVKLKDRLFENLSDDEANQLTIDFLDAMAVIDAIGVDLEPVKWQFNAFILKDNIERISQLSDIPEKLKNQVLEVTQNVLNLYQESIKTSRCPDEQRWKNAENDAWAVSRSALRSSTSFAATWSAARASASAAWAAEKGFAWASWATARSVSNDAKADMLAEKKNTIWNSAESAANAILSAEYASDNKRAKRIASQKYANELLKLLREASNK